MPRGTINRGSTIIVDSFRSRDELTLAITLRDSWTAREYFTNRASAIADLATSFSAPPLISYKRGETRRKRGLTDTAIDEPNDGRKAAGEDRGRRSGGTRWKTTTNRRNVLLRRVVTVRTNVRRRCDSSGFEVTTSDARARCRV